jgi:hypothetical protein
VSWLKAILATLGTLTLLLVSSAIAGASELSRASISMSNETIDGTDADGPPINSSNQAKSETKPRPDTLLDQGALWTPDDAGEAYDLSGPNEDDLLPEGPVETRVP